MPLPPLNLAPPFVITRASHIVLTAADLGASRAFYADMLGLSVSDHDSNALYLRGLEEAAHHSLVIRQSNDTPACARLGFRVLAEDDLDRAWHHFTGQELAPAWREVPHQGRTLHVADHAGMPLEFCASMETAPRLMQDFHLHRGASPQRFDHVQVASPDVQAATDAYAALGFRVTEYTATGNGDELWGTWMQRKGNTHDIAFTNGAGPRLHHFAYTVPEVRDVIHACDVAGGMGRGDVIDRGPGRHGISNALFVYMRDPDGYRCELFTTHYQAIDLDTPPIRWDLSNPRRSQLWGMPATRRWFMEASQFEGLQPVEPALKADPLTLEQFLGCQ